MDIDFLVLIRLILIGSFHHLAMVDQPLDLIHPKHYQNLRIHSHREASSSPLHQCLDAVMRLYISVKYSICDSQTREVDEGILNWFPTNVHNQVMAIIKYFFSYTFSCIFSVKLIPAVDATSDKRLVNTRKRRRDSSHFLFGIKSIIICQRYHIICIMI